MSLVWIRSSASSPRAREAHKWVKRGAESSDGLGTKQSRNVCVDFTSRECSNNVRRRVRAYGRQGQAKSNVILRCPKVTLSKLGKHIQSRSIK